MRASTPARPLYEWKHAASCWRSGAHQAETLECALRRRLPDRTPAAGGAQGRRALRAADRRDRPADDAFEAFLLEFLGEGQITIPSGARSRPRPGRWPILDLNRTRELHDALKRRCLYHWIDYPSPEREAAIVRLHNPALPELQRRIWCAVGAVRRPAADQEAGRVREHRLSCAAAALAGRRLALAEALRRSLGLLVKDREILT